MKSNVVNVDFVSAVKNKNQEQVSECMVVDMYSEHRGCLSDEEKTLLLIDEILNGEVPFDLDDLM